MHTQMPEHRIGENIMDGPPHAVGMVMYHGWSK